MPLDRATVSRIARLARLAVPDEELEALGAELSNILTWVEQLEEVETKDVPPMTSAVEVTLPEREDEVTDGGRGAEILANAPESAQGFFVVPKVLE